MNLMNRAVENKQQHHTDVYEVFMNNAIICVIDSIVYTWSLSTHAGAYQLLKAEVSNKRTWKLQTI